MTTLAVDTCIRADQSGIGTASDGKSWTFVPSSGSEVTAIASNEIVISQYSGSYAFAIIGTGTTGDINILCRMAASYDQQLPGLTFRYTDANNCYFVGFYVQQVYIDKIVSGSRSPVATSGVLSSWAINDYWWLRAIMSGTNITITAWKDGTSEPGSPIVTGSDSTFSSGQYGLVSQTFTDTSNSFDHLTVTDNQSTVTSTRTVPSSGALLQTQTRTIPVAAALFLTQQRSISASSALLQTQSHSIPASSALLETFQRTVPASSVLLQTQTHAIPASTAALQTGQRSISASSTVLATEAHTIPVSSALLLTETHTVPLNTALLLSGNRSIASSATMKATEQHTVPASAVLSGVTTAPSTNATFYVRKGNATFSMRSGKAIIKVDK